MSNEMETGFARLRTSKQYNVERENAEGAMLGKMWALDSADYAGLARVTKIDVSDEVSDSNLAFAILGKADAQAGAEVLEGIFGAKAPSPDMVSGFIDGAVAIFDEV